MRVRRFSVRKMSPQTCPPVHFRGGSSAFVLALWFACAAFCAAADLANNEDVKEFYLGMGGVERKSFKDVKSYKRRKRWLA